MPEFAIHELPCLNGILALSPLPGRTRHYYADWLRLEAWAPDIVVSLTEQHELDRKGSGSLGRDLQNAGVTWRHWPLADLSAPDAAQSEQWPALSAEIRSRLQAGGKVLVHCFGGCGRSGMAVLRILIDTGEAPEAALARLRCVRRCAVETPEQEAWARSVL